MSPKKSPVNLNSDRLLRSLKTEKTQEEFWDEKFSGSFGVRVTKRGTKTFVLRYRFGGWQRRFTLGRYPVLGLADAKKMALDVLREVIRGEDPAEKRYQGRKSKTFKELADDYIERHAKPNKKPASIEEDTRIINTYLLPVWGKRKFESITRSNVIQLLDEVKLKRKAPVMANRVRALASTIFNFASRMALVPETFVNPCTNVEKPTKEKSRERYLEHKEIQALWKDLDDNQKEPAASVYRMILLTGQRPGEVKAMRWSAIKDGEGTAFLTSERKDFVWTIPDSETKNKKEHKVPLSSTSCSVLAKLEPKTGKSEYVFALPKGGQTFSRNKHLKYFQKMTQRILKSMRNEIPEIVNFTLHDLRRTFTTHLSILEINPYTIAKVQNHSLRELHMTAIYNRWEKLPEMKKALDLWGLELKQIVSSLKLLKKSS